jgi:hypothetical protein
MIMGKTVNKEVPMVERVKGVHERCHGKESLESRLSRHPDLRARIEGLLDIIDNAGNDIEKASAAEQRVIEELRKMGNEALQCWAESQERRKAEQFEGSAAGVNKKVKKNSTGTPASEQ